MHTPPRIVAVDCPSGVDCDSGDAAPECIPADLTVTMAAIKRGLLKFPAFNLLGDLRLVGIGLPEGGHGLKAWRKVSCRVADAEWVNELIPPRPLDAHKGTFGTAMVVAGSLNYTGAVLLAGEAAYRAGVGLVTIATPTPLHAALAGHIPEGNLAAASKRVRRDCRKCGWRAARQTWIVLLRCWLGQELVLTKQQPILCPNCWKEIPSQAGELVLYLRVPHPL